MVYENYKTANEKSKVSKIKLLENEYSKCDLCQISRHRKNVCIGNGNCPCDILCIGEAPGKSENLMGKVFCGPSGRLLKEGISDSLKSLNMGIPTMFCTNTIACRPSDLFNGVNRPPTFIEVLNCQQRLIKIIRLCRPKIIIYIGKFAKDNESKTISEYFPDIQIGIVTHPSFILRNGGKQSPKYQEFVSKWNEIFDAFYSGDVL